MLLLCDAFSAACQRHMMVQYCCGSGSTNKLFCKCFLIIIIIIMVIFKCYFSGELIALSLKKYQKNNNNGVNIELGKQTD